MRANVTSCVAARHRVTKPPPLTPMTRPRPGRNPRRPRRWPAPALAETRPRSRPPSGLDGSHSTGLASRLGCSLGAWRSLVARTVWVGEVPGSNPGAPICFLFAADAIRRLREPSRIPGVRRFSRGQAAATSRLSFRRVLSGPPTNRPRQGMRDRPRPRLRRGPGGSYFLAMEDSLTLTAVFTPDENGWTMAQLAEWPAWSRAGGPSTKPARCSPMRPAR
jgi:hypothetical protein